MTTAETSITKADHQAYIEAVRVALLLDDIRVGDATFNTGTVRSASMTLLTPDDDFDEPWHHTFTSAERVELRWTEEEGWSLLALHAAGDRQLPTIWRPGFGAVLPANEFGSKGTQQSFSDVSQTSRLRRLARLLRSYV